MMAIEILFNQPFKKKIKLLHNNIYKKIFSKKFEKLERIEVNSFAFSFFLILQKLFEEEERLKSYSYDLIKNSINHWSCIEKVERDFLTRFHLVNKLWNENSKLVLSRTYDSRIDLIFLLYKSFELGISNKSIIKKNLSVLIFSVSKAQKDFRYDVLQEIKKKIFYEIYFHRYIYFKMKKYFLLIFFFCYFFICICGFKKQAFRTNKY